MRNSRRGVRYAVLGYVLIAVAVIGGMGWATAATCQLARINLHDARMDRLQRALGRLDDYILGVWKVEAASDVLHYQALYNPERIFDAINGVEVDPWRYLLESPLLIARPSQDWIDLYFQVNELGQWSSPQLPDAEQLTVVDRDTVDPVAAYRAARNFKWLSEHMTLPELQRRLTAAVARDRAIHGAEDLEPAALRTTDDERKTGGESAPADRLSTVRRRDWRTVRPRVTPQIKCLPADVAEGIVHGTTTVSQQRDEDADFDLGSVEVASSTLFPFWIETGEGEPPKIAFVRTAQSRDDTIFQGFIGDWTRLKPELVKRVVDLLPQVELEPILDAAGLASRGQSFLADEEMTQLPIRLSRLGPVSAGEVWQAVRARVLLSWAAAVAVLVATGWGVRNLVSLTERRLQFAYAVTHELRTPLTTFRLYIDLLAAGLVPEGSRQQYLDTLNSESQRLSTLVEDVLEYARLENHKVRLHPVELKGDGLLQKLRESLESRCKASGIEPQTQNEVPASQTVRTDVDLVSQIAGVLVNNACRHARQSKSPAVMLRLGTDNGHLLLDVVDTGPGVDRADARRIFKPFRRGRNADVAAQGGVGLGLSLARSWAGLLGGRLELVARQDPQYGGAHFRLTIPTESPGSSHV